MIGHVLAENRGMLQLCQSLGFVITDSIEGAMIKRATLRARLGGQVDRLPGCGQAGAPAQPLLDCVAQCVCRERLAVHHPGLRAAPCGSSPSQPSSADWSACAERPPMVNTLARTGTSSPKMRTDCAPSTMRRPSVPAAWKPTNTIAHSGRDRLWRRWCLMRPPSHMPLAEMITAPERTWLMRHGILHALGEAHVLQLRQLRVLAA